ncbi:MAG: penicillin-binding protein 1A [Xenophilus sp.]
MPRPAFLSNPRTRRALLWSAAGAITLALAAALTLGVAAAVAWRRLPDVSSLANYQPKLPLRVFTADGQLIGEFGEERRQLVPLDQMPRVLKDAVLATEDARFYQHGGLDYVGLTRAVIANALTGRVRQGASTITQQVARNMFLSNERTFSRKFNEALLAWKLEKYLTKDQILEIYLNQIYLGNRAYGFAAAAQTYFGKPVQQLSVAEAAMLAGLPKAPGTNNPVANPRRAVARQQYVIQRMVETGYLGAADADKARAEPLKLRDAADPQRVHAEYVAEMVRQQMVEKYGDAAYTRGLKVYTTIAAADQQAAYAALRAGLMDYEQRQPYRGPEGFVADLPSDPKALDQAVDEALADHPDNGDLVAAVVLEASPKKVVAARANGDTVEITGHGLQAVQRAFAPKAPQNIRIARGAVIRLAPNDKRWEVAQLPEVEGAFVGLDPVNGAVRALVGGFDFSQNKFNHATQAWRQPGSSFKPFIYSAALEKGFSPATLVNDAPLVFDAAATGGQPWEPKNFEGSFEGPMTLRTALQKSKNLVTLRVLQAIGPPYAQEWIGRFGFDPARHPAYLTMGLGAGSVTPMQMAAAYAVFANGGLRVQPRLVTRITDARDQVLEDTPLAPPEEAQRAIPARNAFVMDTLLNSVVKNGTGAKAYAALRRDDLYGKTGTTNDSFDAWFAGFQPTRVGIAWVGYDTPRQLGVRGETGASAALPVWTAYMKAVLKGVPVAGLAVPEGVTQVAGPDGQDWSYDEYANGGGVQALDVDPALASPGLQPGQVPGMGTSVPAELGMLPMGQQASRPQGDSKERNRILDLFR